ncbi:GntR family transcriptional regulator [Roseovarius sp. C7]|uniref:GntR family transcriptional regulator n=1 Tax=Roseovarius sp. C7 TaxID=3398643 RepID=UPI0039F57038
MTQTALAGDDRIPIYQRLADVLRQSVIDGKIKPGDRVPSENVLAEDYGLAAGTVRKALDVLVSEGVFERFQGRGTFVRRPSFDASLFRFFRFRNAEGEYSVPESRILRREVEPMPGHVAHALELAEGVPGISMSRLRLQDDVPTVAEEIWLGHEPFRAFAALPTGEIGDLLYPVYDQLCGQLVARAEETLTVEAASPETARLLRVEEGTPIIVIERVAKGYDNRPIEWRRSRGRAEQFSYHTEIR